MEVDHFAAQQRTFHSESEDAALALFKLGMRWAAIIVGGEELPASIFDKIGEAGERAVSDRYCKAIERDIENIRQIPHIALPTAEVIELGKE